jgi:hypothetical protein
LAKASQVGLQLVLRLLQAAKALLQCGSGEASWHWRGHALPPLLLLEQVLRQQVVAIVGICTCSMTCCMSCDLKRVTRCAQGTHAMFDAANQCKD